jgi:Rrf2 family protein
MLKPSKKLALAVEAVVDIAYHSGAEPVPSQDIAKRLTLPRRYLEQVMQQLVRAGILKGVRGPRGGYRLAREMRRISVGDVLRIVQREEDGGPVALASPSALGEKVMAPFWTDLERELLARLDTVTIEELCERARRAGMGPRPQSSTPDFAI